MGSERSGPRDRFSPTAGRILGGLCVGCLGFAAVLTALHGDTLGAAAGTVALAWGVLAAYVMFLRPAVIARDDHLLLRNMLSDTFVPWHLVDDVFVRSHTTNVYVGDAVHHGTGPGRSLLSFYRRKRERERLVQTSDLPGAGGDDHVRRQPGDWQASDGSDPRRAVEARLRDLAGERAPRSRDHAGRGRVVRRRAWPQTVGLVLLGVVFVVLAALG